VRWRTCEPVAFDGPLKSGHFGTGRNGHKQPSTSVACPEGSLIDGLTSVAGIESLLLRDFADDAAPILQDRVKQFIGFRTRQIMEQMGSVLSQSKVKIRSILFYAGARYKQRDSCTYYVWQRGSSPRKIALSADKQGEKLPSIEPDRWIALQPFTGQLHGVIVYGLKNEAAARKEIAAKGYFEYTRDRLLRVA
jgi:hypothetical protein